MNKLAPAILRLVFSQQHSLQDNLLRWAKRFLFLLVLAIAVPLFGQGGS